MACGCGKRKLAAAKKTVAAKIADAQREQRAFAGPTRWSGSRRTAEEIKA